MSEVSIKAKLQSMGHELDDLSDGCVAELQVAVGSIARGAIGEWARIARTRLHSTREDYVNGLRQSESFVLRAETDMVSIDIQLVGAFPNNIEFGMAPFDMKTTRPGWLGGGKAKVGKDGKRYVIIPFRHSTGQNQGGAQLSMTESNASVIKKVAKDYGLDKMTRMATGQVVDGPTARVPKNASGVHPYLQGMVRIQKGQEGMTKTGKQRGSGQLMTFRVISENSPPSAWMHPGLKAANILPEVEQWVDTQLTAAIGDILS